MGAGSNDLLNEIVKNIWKDDVGENALHELSFSLAADDDCAVQQAKTTSAKEEFKSLVHSCYSMIDMVGPEAKRDFESRLHNFLSSWEKRMHAPEERDKRTELNSCDIQINRRGSTPKRKCVYLPLDEYRGTAERIYNTRLMH